MTDAASARDGSIDDPRRPRRVMLLLLVVPAAWIIFELIWDASGEPAGVRQYGRLVEQLSADHQPAGANGWSVLTQAVREASRIDDEMRRESASTPDDRRPDYSRLRTGPLTARVSIEAVDESAWSIELRAIEAMRSAGVFELLDEAARAPNFVRPMPDDTLLQHVYLAHLTSFRLLARLRVATIRVALLRDDHAEAVAALEQSMMLLRAVSAQTFLIDRLVANGIGRLIADQLAYLIEEFELDEATARAMLAAIDRQLPLAPVSLNIQGERLMALDFIDHAYTDDGHGSGRLGPNFAAGALGIPGRNPFLETLSGTLQADRAETTALLDELYDLLLDEAAQAPLVRSSPARVAAASALWGKLTWRHTVIQSMLPMTTRIHPANDDMNMFVAGARVLLALEAFHARHRRYPEMLEELVPEFLDALPVDPTTEGPFVYQVEGPDEYLLYSVGADGVDDHAEPASEPVDDQPVNLWGQGIWDTNADVMINRSRPATETGGR